MPFLKLKINVPVSVVLTYDEPMRKPGYKEGTFQYLYGFKPIDGGFDVWGATQSAHDLIQALGLKKGASVTLLKEEIEGKNATRFRINDKIMDDFKEDKTGMTIAEVQGGTRGNTLPVLIGRFEDVLYALKEFADAQSAPPPQPEERPPSYAEKPPLSDDEIPF